MTFHVIILIVVLQCVGLSFSLLLGGTRRVFKTVKTSKKHMDPILYDSPVDAGVREDTIDILIRKVVKTTAL